MDEYIRFPKRSDDTVSDRTRALFEVEALLLRMTERGSLSGCVAQARSIARRYPTKLDLMRIAIDCPMLDAELAQTLATRADHLPIATSGESPSPHS